MSTDPVGSERPQHGLRSSGLGWAVRATVLVLVLVGVFVGLRVVSLVRPEAAPTVFSTRSVVVIGVTARYGVTTADRAVLSEREGSAQVAAVSVRPRFIGDCAAAGWTTLGAGRRSAVGGLCDPQVASDRVLDWPQRLSAAAAGHGDAQLGTLAASMRGCVAAVGPGAALAAARPNGTVARYQTVGQFVSGGMRTPCPVTLVDPGVDAAGSDRILTVLAARPDTTVVLTGIGPAPGSDDPALQLLYTVGSTPGGWLTSASTRRLGVVGLTDLTRALIDVAPSGLNVSLPVDGAPLKVFPARVDATQAQSQLDSVAALSDAVVRADVALGSATAVLLIVGVVFALRRRWAVPRALLAVGAVLPAAMLLTGAVPWSEAQHPALVLSLVLVGWVGLLTVLARLAGRQVRAPVAVAGAALTFAAFTVEAALGAVMEPGSMFNSRPVNGGRWYGFGNVTFAAYAAATLVLAGYLAGRLRQAGHRRSALGAVALVGFGAVLCEGWPTMGADFGGVIALTPVVLWLLLVLSGLRVTWRRLLGIGAAAAVLVTAISWLDWRRGPGARSHLGDFVQRVVDGDASDIVLRKAVAAGESLLSPLGVGTLIVGAAIWLVIFRLVLPRLAAEFPTLSSTAVAALAVTVLGTVLNDGGVSILFTLTGSFALLVVGLLVERLDALPSE